MTSRASLETDVLAAVAGMCEKKIWKVNAGANTGADFSLKVGARVGLRPDAKSTLRGTEDGEYSLFVSSAWRLDDDDVLVCRSEDQIEPIVDGLNRLVGKRILDAVVIKPGLALTLRFDDELCLSVFCDLRRRGKQLCYSLGSPDGRQHLVSAGGDVVVAARATRFAWPDA